jgi:hypothetical protein
LALAVTSVLASGAHAQQRSPLKLSLKPTVDIMRSNSPLLLDATLTWSSPRLLEGRLEMDLYLGQQCVARYCSRDVALSENKVTLPLMLPPVTPPDESTTCLLQARFEGTGERIELGAFDVAAQVQRRRVLVAGVVVSEGAQNPPRGVQTPEDQPFALQESLRIESRMSRDDLLRDVSCRVVEVLPDAVPECGLELSAFDTLVVTRDGLDELRTDQLEAIADWVEAGGSACLMLVQLRDRRQQALLQRIAGGSAEEPVLAFDANGTPRLLHKGPAGWHRGAPGIGRSIVADAPIDVQGSEWQREVCYLLGVRANQVADLLAHDQQPAAGSSLEETGRFDIDYQPLAPRPLPDEARLPALLMPDKIEGVPFRIVCGLLAGCLLAVAPGEYFLLGLLRRRRWTWVVFPCTAVGCTLFMIGLAQSYVGNADHATSLTFVDLAADGRVVRTSRFELTFTATERRLDAPVERRFVVAIDPGRWRAAPDEPGTWAPVQYERPSTATPFDVAQAPFEYNGRAPLTYTLSRPMRQWSPRLARWTAFGPQAAEEPKLPGVDWSTAAVESLVEQSAQRALAARIGQTAQSAHVLVASSRRSMWLNAERLGFAPDDPAAPIAGLVFAASVREPEHMFQYFALRSPTCAAEMEDLALLDRTDPRQKLVVVLVADGEGSYTAYRRLERGLE